MATRELLQLAQVHSVRFWTPRTKTANPLRKRRTAVSSTNGTSQPIRQYDQQRHVATSRLILTGLLPRVASQDRTGEPSCGTSLRYACHRTIAGILRIAAMWLRACTYRQSNDAVSEPLSLASTRPVPSARRSLSNSPEK